MTDDKIVTDQIDKILAEIRGGTVSTVKADCACQHEPSVSGANDSCLEAVAREPELVDRMVSCGACRISSTLGVKPDQERIGRLIDHTLLKADATESEIVQLCQEAKTYCFASVCINPCWVKQSAQLLSRSGVMVCTVVGFPLGATSTQAKALETQTAVSHGANEIDMVINVGWLKSGLYDLVKKDIAAVVRHAGRQAPVKVIIETCLLTDEEKIKACVLSKEAGAAYVKTSTGFAKSGATASDIALMRRVVGEELGVKASGGVRTYDDAVAMVASGASRIGASASVKIVTGKVAEGSGY